MKQFPEIGIYKSEIFENIQDYDLIAFEYESVGQAEIKKLGKHYETSIDLNNFVIIDGNIIEYNFSTEEPKKPILFLFSINQEKYFDCLSEICRQLNGIEITGLSKIGIQLLSHSDFSVNEHIKNSFQGIESNKTFSFHIVLPPKLKTNNALKPSVFISYDLNDEYDILFAKEISGNFKDFNFYTVESSRFNMEDIIAKINKSEFVISLLTQSHQKGVWFRRDIDVALKTGKAVFVIRKEGDKLELPPEYLNKVILLNSGKDDIYKEVLQIINSPRKSNLSEQEPEKFIPIAAFNSDSVNDNKTDKLNITSDVKALARLLAYKELTPPISVALFGNWGSGKSFFMERLEEEIKHLVIKSKEKNVSIPVCGEIAHIKFNAWHFMDANLWASLVFHIFEELNKACGNLTPAECKEIDLFKNLASCEELTQEAIIKKDEAETNYNNIQERISNLVKEKVNAENTYKLKINDVIDITTDITESDEKLKTLQKELGINKIKGLTLNISKTIVTDFASTYNRMTTVIKNSLSQKKNVLTIFFIFSLSALVCLLLLYLLKNPDISLFAKKMISYGISILTLFIAWYKKVITPVWSRIKTAIEYLDGINKKVELLKQQALVDLKVKIENSEMQLKTSLTILQEKQTALVEAEQNLQFIQSEIDSYKHSKLLSGFIQQRMESDDYVKHLGLISTIRKDLESLSDLITSKKNQDKTKPFDRIILYIDDLDRCPEERVVEVLEAIHLLLAFPLFVVVVGVDPRWVSNALKKKYPGSLTEGLPSKAPEAPLNLNSATTLDYLEKIFQLPLLLKKASPENSMNLIESIFDKDRKRDLVHGTQSRIGQKTPEEIPDEIAKATVNMRSDNIRDRLSETGTESRNKIIQFKTNPNQSIIDNTEKQDIAETYKKLEITGEEINFIQSIAVLIGTTPRSIKRFINTYRLIRSHDFFNSVDNNIEILQAIIVFLALANSPDIAMRKLVNNWAKNGQIAPPPDSMDVPEPVLQILKNIKLNESREYLSQVLRYSFYFEG
ncbi:MAG: hypothetical protein JXB34_14425 [Bacteroidales bacterium]|nr:hypothetical protein [Bacteroidales bacterium]